MPIYPIKTRLYEGPIDPDLLLFVDFRYTNCYDGGTIIKNLAKVNTRHIGDGTSINNPSYSPEEGGSLYFGNTQRITFFDNVNIYQETPVNENYYTISAYVKPQSIAQLGVLFGRSILQNSNSDNSNFNFNFGNLGFGEVVGGINPNNPNLYRFGFGVFGNATSTVTTATYSTDEWYHLAITKDYIPTNASNANARYIMYINGQRVGLSLTSGLASVSGVASFNVHIGSGGGIAAGGPFFGRIAQVKFWKRTLTGKEIYNEFISSKIKPYTIGTKKTSSDIILYLADKGTNAGWGDNSMYSNGARLLGGAQFNSGLILSNTSMYASGTLRTDPGQNFTISSFFTCVGTSTSGYHAIFSINTGPSGVSPSTTLILRVSDGLGVEFVYADNGVVFSIPNVFKKNVLTHLAVTVSQSGGNRIIKLFVNGVLVENGSPLLTPASVALNFDFSTRNYKIGRWRDTGPFVHQFNGKIHNVILHNRTLSDTEVQNLYAAMPSSYKSNESSQNQIPTSDRILYVDGAEPKSYYAETGGLTFKDLSGFSRNGTLSRANRLQSGTPKTGTYPEFKKFNGGYFSFNGFLTADASNPDQKGNSYISFSNPGNFLPESGNPSTIIAWARASASGSTEYRYIFSYGTYNVSGQNRYVGIKYPNKFSIGGGGASAAILDVDGMIPGQWFQIAFVYISGEMRLFVNGTLKQIKSYTLNTNIPFTSAHIGRGNTPVGADTNTNDGYFYGDIAQVIVYDRALNEQEIYQHYKATYERFRLPRVTRPTSVAVITNPFVTTIPIEQRTLNSAKSGVIINFDGNTNIQSSGILYRLSSQTGTFEWNGPGVSSINGSSGVLVNITGLSPNTSYQVKGYAWNGSYYGYGEPLTFTTLSVSVLTVVAVTASFTGLFADASGQVTDLGGNTNYTRRGFVWSNSTINVSTADNITSTRVEEVSPTPPFYTNTSEIWNLRIEPLLQTTTYYLRSFAKTQTGNYVYSSNELVFTTYTFATINVIIPTATGDILSTTAKITGNLLNTGGTNVTQRGIVWSTSQNPTITDSQTNNGPGSIGSFVGQLNGLSAGTLYYVRAYAINSAGIAYSTQASFTTDNVPTVTTSTMLYSNLYPLAYQGPPPPKQSATASGIITDTGNDPITEVGFYYSKTTPVNISTATKVSITTGITNNFAVTLPTLDSSTLYYFVAFAKNINGNGYGSELSFKTLYQPTVLGGSSISQNNSTPGSVTLRSYVDKNNFGNSDFYNQPLTVGFSYAKQPSGTLITQDVSTTYTLNTAQQVAPNNYFTLNLNLDPSSTYTITAYAINKGIAGTLTFNITTFDLPTVTTTVVSNISFDGAQGGGVVTSNGGSTIISRGVVWTIDDLIDPEYGVDTGTDLPGASPTTFNAAISNLDEGTTYYYRSYARNSAGVGYGIKRSLTTTSRVGVATNVATATTNSATLNGTTTIDLGGYTDIDEVGFYWSTVQANLPSQPAVGETVTTTATKVPAGTDVGLGDFTTTITSLTPGTTYYYVAYTKNPAGTSIGLPSRNFVTTSVIKTTVTIGSQGTITNTSIQITGSSVTNAGGGTVTVRGVCWGTSQFPILGTSNFTSDGSGLGSYNSSITGLVQGTTYYIRAYATNEAGTNYSTQITVITYLITTGSVENSFSNKLDVNGSIIVWDTPPITARGVVWSTSQNPTVSLSTKTSNGTGTGTFNSPNVQILFGNTTYYIRAYVTTNTGVTYYGNQIQFTTPAHPQISNTILNSVPYQEAFPNNGPFTFQSKFYNYSFSTLTYHGFRVVFDGPTTRLSDLWQFGFVRTTTQPATVGALTASTLGSINTVITANNVSRISTEPNNIYGGPSDASPDFRPWYYRTYITDGVNTVYSGVIKQVHLPKTTSTANPQVTQGTSTIALRIDTMKTGDVSPVIINHGVTYFPITTTLQSFSPSGTYYNVSFNSAPTLNAQNTVNIVQDIRSIPFGSRYVIMAWVEYNNPVDGLIRIHSQRGEFVRPAVVLVSGITTGSPNSITSSGATITGSNIDNNGGGTIAARGVCWATTQNPTITNSKTNDFVSDATAKGLFNSSITGLAGGTLYYVRAYVTNEAGTAYGAQISFTTTSAALSVLIDPITDLVVDSTLNTAGTEKAKITFTARLSGITGTPDVVGVQWHPSASFSGPGGGTIANTHAGGSTANVTVDNTISTLNINANTAYNVRAFVQKNGVTYNQPGFLRILNIPIKIVSVTNQANSPLLTYSLDNPGSYALSQIEILYSSVPIVMNTSSGVLTTTFTDQLPGPWNNSGLATTQHLMNTRTYTTGWFMRLRITISTTEGTFEKISSNQITLS